ncbi:MAG: hypothetical protein ABEI77_06905 [Halorientalis sp.]
MSTQRSTSDRSRPLPTQTESTPAPLMFSTDNEVPIQGLFKAESDDPVR